MDIHTMRNTPGFTLIELAVVIAVIAILAAVAFPRLASLGDEAERASVQDNLQKLHTAYGIYTAEQSSPPTSFDDFVSNAPLTSGSSKTYSISNMGKGGCQVQSNQIQCQQSDFPRLSDTMNGPVIFTLQNQAITVNLPTSP